MAKRTPQYAELVDGQCVDVSRWDDPKLHLAGTFDGPVHVILDGNFSCCFEAPGIYPLNKDLPDRCSVEISLNRNQGRVKASVSGEVNA